MPSGMQFLSRPISRPDMQCKDYTDGQSDGNTRVLATQRLPETHAAKGVQLESWGTFVEGRNGFFQNEVLLAIANNHHVSVAQVALRWLIQRSIVCIPKTIHKERMAQNMDVFTFQLSDEEMETIKTLDLNKSMFYSHHDPRKWSG